MLQLTPHHRLLLAVEPVDFTPRRGGNCSTYISIAITMPNILPQSSLSFNKGRSNWVSHRGLVAGGIWVIRLFFSDGNGFSVIASPARGEISAADLNVLLYQGNPEFSSIGKPFKKVRPKAAFWFRLS